MRIQGLCSYRRGCSIEELPEPFRWRARQLLNRLVTQAQRRGRRLESWYVALLHGQAKRLTLNPPDSAWGRSMRAKKGGYAVQRRYREEGRIGSSHPAVGAYQVSASRRKWRRQQAEEARRRERLGLPPKPRHKYLPLF